LADRVGISVSSVSAYERGTRQVSLDDLRSISEVFGLLVSELLAGVYPYGTRQEPTRSEPARDGRRTRHSDPRDDGST
jgi:transcriptional regulator with XRE-family HTH domain